MAVHKRMTRSERAKQFMPFAALRGYEEALRRAEEKHAAEEECRELSGCPDRDEDARQHSLPCAHSAAGQGEND